MKTRFSTPLVLLALLGTLTACNFPGDTDTWYVATTGSNNNDCLSPENPCQTIQGAIAKADNADTIIIAEGTYTEDAYENKTLWIRKSLVLRGAGPQATIVDGRGDGTVIHVSGNHLVTLEGMTITNGNNPPPYVDADQPRGAGIYNQGSTLAIVNTIVTGNIGAGIYTRDGGLVITDSTISTNSHAGGVWVYGGVTNINDSTITDNQSTNHGGGISIRGDGILNISGSTISGNTAAFNGGGIHVGDCDQVAINGSTIRDNIAESNGGGVAIESDQCAMTITGTSVSNNTADGWGGGIAVWGGSLTFTNSVVSDNIVRSSGGGIVFDSLNEECGQALIDSSTISGNETMEHSGGGIYLQKCNMIVTNTTVSGNASGGGNGGGGLFIDGNITLTSSTIAGNTSPRGGEGLHISDVLGLGGGGRGSIVNTIVANNGQVDCAGEIGNVLSVGNNLDASDTCGFDAPGDLSNTDPLLGPLADNGGGTLTHALLPGSPAINAAGEANCPPADQRGVERPQDQACDIGAFESEEPGAELLPGLPISITPQEEGSECTVTALTNLFCRPSPGYAPSDSFTPGQSTTAFAQSPGGDFLFVYGINDNRQCTVPNDPKYVELSGDACNSLPTQSLLPTPTVTSTSTATSPPPPKPLAAPAPNSPTGTLNCADVTGGVTLTWSAVSHLNGIDHYEWVLEGAPNDSGNTGNTQATTKTLSCAGVNYQWRVRAVDGKGNIGPWSNYLQFNVP